MHVALWGSSALVGAERVHLEDANITDNDPSSPYDARAYFKLNSGGGAYRLLFSLVGSDQLLWTWLVSGAAGDYEVRATLNSGTLAGGTTGSWLALSTTREWYAQRTSAGSTAANLTIEIRDASTLVVLASCTVVLTANAG